MSGIEYLYTLLFKAFSICEIFKEPYSLMYLLSQLFLSQAFCSVKCLFQLISMVSYNGGKYMLLNVFNKHSLEVVQALGLLQLKHNVDKPLCQSFRELAGQNTEPQLFKNKVHAVPSGTSNGHHKCRLPSLWPPLIWGLADGQEVV